MKEGLEGAPKNELENLDEKQQAEMENVWAALEQQASKFQDVDFSTEDAEKTIDLTNFDGEKNVRIDDKGVEHERTESDFDLNPRQKGESSADYGIRLKWQHEAQRIMDETPREENESLEDYNARVKKMIPSLQEYRDSQNRSKWSTLDDKEKRALHDKYPRKPGESTNDWAKRIEAAEGGAVFSHGHNQFAEQLKTVQEQNAENGESINDSLAEMRKSLAKIQAISERYSQLAEELKTKRAKITPIVNHGDAEPQTPKAPENNEDKEAKRKEALRFVRGRSAVKFYAELGVKASDIENYSDEELDSLKQKIEEKLAAPQDQAAETLTNEERIAKNRHDLRSRKYAKYLKKAGVDVARIDEMSDEELALALGSVEIAYEKDMRAKEEEERRKAGVENQPKARTIEIGGFETEDQAKEALKKIAGQAIAIAEVSGKPKKNNIDKIVNDVMREDYERKAKLEKEGYSEERVARYNALLESYKKALWEANNRLQNTKDFFGFKQRKIRKEINDLTERIKRTEADLAAELEQRPMPQPTNPMFVNPNRPAQQELGDAA